VEATLASKFHPNLSNSTTWDDLRAQLAGDPTLEGERGQDAGPARRRIAPHGSSAGRALTGRD
jgi:hypothetical protein